MRETPRRLTAEALGTSLLLYVIVGSGIAVEQLGGDAAAGLMAHALAVGLALAALIAFLGPVSGAHFNPAVTLGFWRTAGIDGRVAMGYVSAQLAGAVVGVVVANWTFGVEVWALSDTVRLRAGTVGAEAVATFVLVVLILGLVRTGAVAAVAPAVGAWIAAGIFSTSSTAFANPAVTVARMATATFTGIDPGSVTGFVVAQLIAGLAAAAVAVTLFPVAESTRVRGASP